MSWNEILYVYQKEKGGVFMGSRAADWDGELILSCRDEPLVVRTIYETPGGSASTTIRNRWISIRARIMICLERDYELRIRPKSAMSTGLNTVLGVLDRGLEKLPSGPDLHEDYGCPEVTRGRTITTTDRSFTKLVLRDLELRNALLASPKDGLLILPGPGREGLHLVESYSYPQSTGADWYSELRDLKPDWTDSEEERVEKRERRENLDELARNTLCPRLDKLIGLTKAARGAALTWRMGTPG